MRATAELATSHRRLAPHLDHIERIAAAQLDDLPAERLGSMLLAALDCVDDDRLEHLVECEAVLYPAAKRVSDAPRGATRVLRMDQRMMTELRHEVRRDLASDLDWRRSGAVREKLYGLALLLRGHITKHEELFVPLLEELRSDTAPDEYEESN